LYCNRVKNKKIELFNNLLLMIEVSSDENPTGSFDDKSRKTVMAGKRVLILSYLPLS